MATIRDVAAKAGVSVATVSRVMNNRGYLSEEIREKVRQAMEDLNYRPSEVARSLSNKCTNIIGVLFPALNNAYYAEIASELSRCLTEKGYKMMLYVAFNIDDAASEYVSMLQASRVDGMIIALRSKAIDRILTPDMPVVFFSRFRGTAHPTVLCDDEMGGRLAARELIDCGCKKPAMVGFFHSHDIPAYARLIGFLSELQEAGLEERSVQVFGSHPHDEFDKLTDAALLQYPDSDGFFCSDDVLAATLMQKLTRQGKRIPQDVQVVGFNSCFLARSTNPPLTSIRQPIPQMCEEAVECLLNQIGGQTGQKEITLPVSVERRGSTVDRTNAAL